MFCDRCGNGNRDEATFCRACGQPLAEPTTRPLTSPPTPRPSDVPEAVRQALGKGYRVERLLGRGGMGAVYLAHELALDRPVAVKVMGHDAAGDDRAAERFLREARLAAKLRHPHIVSIHAVGREGNLCYFTMDYIDGASLEDHVRGHGPSPEPEARQLIVEVLRAVGHAHDHGVVHRDLKPGNVMRDAAGHAVVLDFGLARAVDATIPTTSGVVVGTPQYLSPEQIEGHDATPASDLYAIGLIYVFLRTGRHLVAAGSPSEIVAQHLAGRLRDRVAALAEMQDAPGVLRALVDRRPDQRAASARAVLVALGSVSGHHAAPTPAPSLPEAAPDLPPLSPHRKEARDRIKKLLDKIPRRDGSSS